ncbi:MAG: hypothetical protein K9J13_16015, partial [Saprospiraceae bacterium]|nr:hypothetical protein [Saprospiraceae bacterium]
MKIIQKKSKIKFINHDYKFRRLIFTSFIISFFSLLILGGGYFIAKKNGINLKIVKQWSGQITYWLPYHAKALFVSPKKISIHI